MIMLRDDPMNSCCRTSAPEQTQPSVRHCLFAVAAQVLALQQATVAGMRITAKPSENLEQPAGALARFAGLQNPRSPHLHLCERRHEPERSLQSGWSCTPHPAQSGSPHTPPQPPGWSAGSCHQADCLARWVGLHRCLIQQSLCLTQWTLLSPRTRCRLTHQPLQQKLMVGPPASVVSFRPADVMAGSLSRVKTSRCGQ